MEKVGLLKVLEILRNKAEGLEPMHDKWYHLGIADDRDKPSLTAALELWIRTTERLTAALKQWRCIVLTCLLYAVSLTGQPIVSLLPSFLLRRATWTKQAGRPKKSPKIQKSPRLCGGFISYYGTSRDGSPELFYRSSSIVHLCYCE